MGTTCKIAKNLMMDLLDLAQHENSSFKLNTEPFSLLKTIQNSL